MRNQTKIKTLKEKLFKWLPLVALFLLQIEFDFNLWPELFTTWFVVHAVIAAGIAKLLFPQLFDDYMSRQRKISDAAKAEYTQLQIRRFSLVHLTFFVSWWLLNLIKFL